jgi:hypothetical protein
MVMKKNNNNLEFFKKVRKPMPRPSVALKSGKEYSRSRFKKESKGVDNQ